MTTIIQDSSIMLSASDIKSFQYVLITKAGLAVSEKREMSLKMIESDVLSEFEAAVKNCVVPENLRGLNTILLLRSKNFLAKTCSLDDYHTGESIWRKFADIKKVICNDFTDLYHLQMPGGIPPSGVSFAEVLNRTREAIFVRTKKGIYNPAWFPTEWLVFTT